MKVLIIIIIKNNNNKKNNLLCKYKILFDLGVKLCMSHSFI